MTVERVRVGDVLRLERRPVDPDPLVEYTTIGVRSFGKGIFHYDPVPGAQLGKLRFFTLQPDCLVISNIKGWEGAIAVSKDSDTGCLASSRFLTYVPIGDRVDVRWARWFFLADAGIALIQQASPGSADRNRTLAIDRFEAIEIPLPPIEEQLKLARRLESVAAVTRDLAAVSGRSNHLSEALRASLAVRPDLRQAEKIRAGWERVSLGSVMMPAEEKVKVEPDQTYPNVGILSFGRGLFRKPDIDGSQTSAQVLNRLRVGQFVYSRLFAFEGAYACVSLEHDGRYVSNEFPAFDPNPERLDTTWLANYLRAPSKWVELAGSSKGLGVRRQRVPAKAILAYEVWLPPIETQRAIVAAIEKVDLALARSGRTKELLDSLVPAALNEAFTPR